MKELGAQQYLDTNILQRFALEGFEMLSYKSLRSSSSFRFYFLYSLLFFLVKKNVFSFFFFLKKENSLAEDITCGDIKAELSSRLRVRVADVELLVSQPDGTTEVFFFLVYLFLFFICFFLLIQFT